MNDIDPATDARDSAKKKGAHREPKLDRAQRDDEDAEDDGDGAVADDLRRRAQVRRRGLPRAHPVPVPGVEQRLTEVSPASAIVAIFPVTHLSGRPKPATPKKRKASVSFKGFGAKVPTLRSRYKNFQAGRMLRCTGCFEGRCHRIFRGGPAI